MKTRVLIVEDVAKEFSLGADAYVTKPFSNKHLPAQIRRLAP